LQQAHDYRACAHVAVMVADAVHAGCLEKFLYIYSSLVRDYPKASWVRIADQALAKALWKGKP
jgi:hypothetical protein